MRAVADVGRHGNQRHGRPEAMVALIQWPYLVLFIDFSQRRSHSIDRALVYSSFTFWFRVP